MIIKTDKVIPEHEITDPHIFYQRRKLVKALLAGSIYPALPTAVHGANEDSIVVTGEDESTTPIELVTNYTNYYEFTFDKKESSKLAQNLKVYPWTLAVSGEVENPLQLSIDSLINHKSIKECVYRLRCVEGWSMVVPWLGFPLADLLKQAKPLSTAKFVKFVSVHQPDVMHNRMLEWPYIEGLRIDEAYHPLTILAVGMYGVKLPKQNGAPIRLVVPWKYGFKSIKAVVKIELTSIPPRTTWNKFAPNEYGFYANVNPNVPHPRWSQISERRLGSSFFSPRRKTELFNGYGEQVASLYRDLDLVHFY
jgi:sulfoxide reductase catalytic subunit YedY